jgi:hypothetical protein
MHYANDDAYRRAISVIIGAAYPTNSIPSQEPEHHAAIFTVAVWQTAWQVSATYQMFGTI